MHESGVSESVRAHVPLPTTKLPYYTLVTGGRTVLKFGGVLKKPHWFHWFAGFKSVMKLHVRACHVKTPTIIPLLHLEYDWTDYPLTFGNYLEVMVARGDQVVILHQLFTDK